MNLTPSQEKRWNQVKADHKLACDGSLTKSEFFAQPFDEQVQFADWLRKQARDIIRDAYWENEKQYCNVSR